MPSNSTLDRKQIDARYDHLRVQIPMMRAPRGGWLRLLRTALGMRQRDLGARMGVSAQAVAQLEAREQEGSVTLGALREAARAMGAEVFYVIVPERSVSVALRERADAAARLMLRQVHHSMRMEDQETGAAERDARLAELTEELLRSPSALWDLPDDG